VAGLSATKVSRNAPDDAEVDLFIVTWPIGGSPDPLLTRLPGSYLQSF